MIEVDERFEVPAPPTVVWQLLADPHAVVTCVPGAAIVAEQDDGSLAASLTVRFGPVAVAFQAHAIVELHTANKTGRISARGKDKQGGARFEATATFSVSGDPAGSGAVVAIHAQVDISGRLASLIEGGASVVVKRMSAEFSTCLNARCLALS
jgi:uncharacterized protein